MNLKEQVLKNIELSKKKEEFQKYIKTEEEVEQNKDVINFIEQQILENSLKKIDTGIIDVSKFDVIFKTPREYNSKLNCKGNLSVIWNYLLENGIQINISNKVQLPTDYSRFADYDYDTYKILSINYELRK